MISVVLLIAAIAWIGVGEKIVKTISLGRTYRPSPATVIAISAAKNLSRFVIVFAILYAMKMDFDHVENWPDFFRR